MKGRPGRLDDAVALSALVTTAIVIALPILRGGYLTYLDNPVHLAEIGELAEHGTNAWSEIGFTGIPLGTLHSPLWYGLLAFWARAGAPIGPLYALWWSPSRLPRSRSTRWRGAASARGARACSPTFCSFNRR
jgi:hypothetical protein